MIGSGRATFARPRGGAASGSFAATGTADVTIALEPSFDFLSAGYATLFQRSNATAFQHPIWLQSFYALLAARRGAEPLVVVGREAGTGTLLFVLPMIRRNMSGIVLVEATDLGVSDYCAPVAVPDLVRDDRLAARVEAVLGPFDLIRVRPIREEHVNAWKGFVAGKSERLDFAAHAAELSAPYPAWRGKALESSYAKYLDRKRKRFFKTKGASLRLLSEPADIAAAIAAIRSLRSGRFEEDQIQQDFVCDFYADVAVKGAAAGLARTYALTAEGQDLGYVFGLTCNGRFYYLLIGCDYERHGRHSPGLILYDTIIENWISSGGTVFDFTIGDEPFKRDFGTAPTAMYTIVRAPSWKGKLARAALEAREQMRRLGRQKRGEKT